MHEFCVLFAALAFPLYTQSAPADEGVAERVDAALEALYPPDGLGAVVLAARGEEIVFSKAYGLANLEHGVPMTPDAVFRAASVNKLFTAFAVLGLVEEGQLELDDLVTKHLPGFPKQDGSLTVRHLLTHTSGLPEVLDRQDALTRIRSELTLDELIASFAERERVFGPAGMTNTRSGDFNVLTPGPAAGYEADGSGGFFNEKYYSASVLTGAGDGLTTTGDLHRFFVALFGGALMSKSTLLNSLRR